MKKDYDSKFQILQFIELDEQQVLGYAALPDSYVAWPGATRKFGG